jgi:uncharacterized damage-inducible protein DinB
MGAGMERLRPQKRSLAKRSDVVATLSTANVYDHNAAYDDVTAGFVAESRRNLIASFVRIQHCLKQLSEEQVWWRANSEMNSVGNLLLHLSGNVGQWLVLAVTGTASTRNRPAEFAQREPFPKSEVLGKLKETVEAAVTALDSIKEAEQLLARRRIQGNETTVLTAIYHSVSHFEGHAQEIISMTRQMRGERYEFLWVPKTSEQKSAG